MERDCLLSRIEQELVKKALSSFSTDPGNRRFNTAGVQAAVERLFPELGCPTGEDVARMLQGNTRIVQLSGGAHWYLLPGGLHRQ
jgi:hypothetical protein